MTTEQIETFITSSYGIFSGQAKYTAMLEFTPERAKWVVDESWHPEQSGQWLENGKYLLSFPFNDSRELIMDILKHGAEVEVIEPVFLREAIKQHIEQMKKKYKK